MVRLNDTFASAAAFAINSILVISVLAGMVFALAPAVA